MSDHTPLRSECDGVREAMYPYLDGQLDPNDRVSLESHLRECHPCQHSLEVERFWGDVLISTLRRHPAPPGLHAKVRVLLKEESERASVSAWRRLAPVTSLAAVLIVAALLLATPIRSVLTRPRPAATPRLEAVASLAGVIVDLECDRRGLSFEQQRRCADLAHFNVLKDVKGGYYTLVRSEVTDRMITDRSLRGHPLRVWGTIQGDEGRLELQLDRLEWLPEGQLL